MILVNVIAPKEKAQAFLPLAYHTSHKIIRHVNKTMNICKLSELSICPIITLQMKLCLSKNHLGYVNEKGASTNEMKVLVITFRLFKSHLGPTIEMETSTNQIQVLVIITFSFFI